MPLDCPHPLTNDFQKFASLTVEIKIQNYGFLPSDANHNILTTSSENAHTPNVNSMLSLLEKGVACMKK